MTAAIYGIISIPLFLVLFFTAKEKIQPQKTTDKFSVKDVVGNLVKNKYLMLICLIMMLIMTGFMGRMAVLSYYVIYCLGSFQLIAVIMTVPTVLAIFASFFVPMAVKKLGKRNVLMGSVFIEAIGLLIVYFAPFDNVTMVLAGCVVFGLFNIAMPVTLSMLSDSVDYMDLKTGVRTDGTAYATYGLATKVGNALGGSVGVVLLAAFGYVANQQQTVEAMKGINVVVNLIPAILYIFAGLCCLLWKISDKDADEIREKIKERDMK